MGISNALPPDLNEVDVIIAGGGTAGCILASRLAEADPSLSILIIEHGQNNYNDPKVVNPCLFTEHIAPGSTSAIFYESNPAPQLGGLAPVVPSGGILGGGSSINFMLYVRAQGADFDAWNMPGWSAKDVLPYLKKLETYSGAGNFKTHGSSGPIQISDGGYRNTEVTDSIIKGAGTAGFPEIEDVQDLTSVGGFSRWWRYVGPDGRRQDVAHRYLHPLLQDGKHPNLHVLVEHRVFRVLFDDQPEGQNGHSNGTSGPLLRATGVEFTPNPLFHDGTADIKDKKQTVRAKKLVVVSSGALGTPSVLERSGIGAPEVLAAAGVPLAVDLPAVGNYYQDHNMSITCYKAAPQFDMSQTLDVFLRDPAFRERVLAEKTSFVGWNGFDVGGKVRPTEEEVDQMGPELRAAWDRDFRDKPERPLMLMAANPSFFGDPALIPSFPVVSMADYTAYPYSRGRIHITGPEADDPPSFDTGYLTDEHDLDVKVLVWAYKKNREIFRRSSVYYGELDTLHPVFPPGSKAALTEGPALCACKSTFPAAAAAATSGTTNGTTTGNHAAASTSGCHDGIHVIKDIEYTPEDDEAIAAFVRKNMATTWHSLGTARMAPREQDGVVDARLNVYGTRGLKVADMSIAPFNVAANTNNTALMIGERAAALIAEDLGIA